MTENSVPEPLVPQDKLKHIELTEEQLKEISGGGTATGWGYTYGDKWHGKCTKCNKKTDFTCIHTGCVDIMKYTWWRCDECGSVWRWNPGFVWANWDWTRYDSVADARARDDQWHLPSDGGHRDYPHGFE